MSQNLLHCHAQRDACLQALAADLLAQIQTTLTQQARAGLILPGGSSPQALLPLLAQQLDSQRIDLSPSDERWVPAQAAESNWQLLHQGLPQANCLDPRQGAGAGLDGQGRGFDLYAVHAALPYHWPRL